MSKKKLICYRCKDEIKDNHDYIIYVSRKDNKKYTFHTMCILTLLKIASFEQFDVW